MKRYIVFFFVFALVCSTGLAISGYLSATKDWNLISYFDTIELTDKTDDDLKGIPSHTAPLYGEMTIGDRPVNLLFYSGPVLMVDTNDNGEFSDDEHLTCTRRTTNGDTDIYRWETNVRVDDKTGAVMSGPSYRVTLIATQIGFSGKFMLQYSVTGHREGVIEIVGKPYGIGIFPTNASGAYDLPNEVLFGIDLNMDGRIDLAPASREVFAGTDTIGVEGKNYTIASIALDGSHIELRETALPASNKPELVIGQPFPDFATVDISGNDVSTSSFTGYPVVFVISPALPSEIWFGEMGDCQDCQEEMPFFDSRLFWLMTSVEELSKRNTNYPRVVWLSSGSESDIDIDLPWLSTIDDEETLSRYGYSFENRMFIIDKFGTLRAMDEYWYVEESFGTEKSMSGKKCLSQEDIKSILNRLMLE